MYTPLTKLGTGIATPSWGTDFRGSPSKVDVSNIYSVLGGSVNTAGQSASVLEAFRNLKAKAKTLESEHKEIRRENDELRSQLSQSRRDSYKYRMSPQEVQQMDSIMRLRKDTEDRRKEVNELERDLMILEDSNRSIERAITSARARLASLDDDALHVHSSIRDNERETAGMQAEYKALEESCEGLQRRIAALPQAKQLQTDRMKDAVANMESEVQKVRSATEQSKLRASGLHRYIEMMIGVNSELCDTILAREEAKARVMRIAEKMSPPPNSETPLYSDVLSAISRRHASAALESETRKAVADARSVLKMHSALYADIRPTAQPNNASSRQTSQRAEKKTDKSKGKNASASGTKKTKSAKKTKLVDFLTTDVEAIAEASKLFAQRAVAAANLHVPAGPHHYESPTPIPMSSLSPGHTPIELALSGGQKGSPVFVPSGSSVGNDTYNAYASVSKSVRAARQWNQQIQSHIKSLEFGGVSEPSGLPMSFHERRRGSPQ